MSIESVLCVGGYRLIGLKGFVPPNIKILLCTRG